ncbi:glycosyltransferase family 2 protein [Pelagibacterium luteolum]|uniref:Glycosyl transferase family 2 n=1 Tax=Pelagibacterium luteolum TaxID=440168 RepID=A0A1G7W0V6_9HYPH|nr:glycosyltransferase family A protein [Pelagibacterium luteolum]SDG65498.1 Glycosyl transferase family 2 [Pelagibacterium luteolum]
MDVAFVIPAHNEEALLGDCLKSVLEEIDRSHLCGRAEVVVVDNASTDRTSEVASAFQGVTVVREERKGLGYARKAGFDNSTAEFVANIDADTLVPEGWLDIALGEFQREQGLVCVSGPYIYHDLPWHSRAITEGFYYITKGVYGLNRYVLKVGSVVQGGNFVFKREAWAKAGGYNPSITFYGEDTDIAVRLSRVGGVKWTFKLRMLTSGRRLQKQGVVRTGLTYTLNFFAVTFRGKPATSKYEDYRD